MPAADLYGAFASLGVARFAGLISLATLYTGPMLLLFMSISDLSRLRANAVIYGCDDFEGLMSIPAGNAIGIGRSEDGTDYLMARVVRSEATPRPLTLVSDAVCPGRTARGDLEKSAVESVRRYADNIRRLSSRPGQGPPRRCRNQGRDRFRHGENGCLWKRGRSVFRIIPFTIRKCYLNPPEPCTVREILDNIKKCVKVEIIRSVQNPVIEVYENQRRIFRKNWEARPGSRGERSGRRRRRRRRDRRLSRELPRSVGSFGHPCGRRHISDV